jgi:hypothetical protein
VTLTPIAMLATAAVLALTCLWVLTLYRRECGRSRQAAVAFNDLEETLVSTQQQLHRAEARRLRAERRARKHSADLLALEAEQARFLATITERPRQLFLSLDSKLEQDYRQALGAADQTLLSACALKRDAVQTIISCMMRAGIDQELRALGNIETAANDASARDTPDRNALIRSRVRELVEDPVEAANG